jgi:hypothetical protein
MNKKLLCTSALIGSLVSGVALAELKIGGDITHTINVGSNETNAADNNVASERFGSEMNLTIASKKDLNNGMYVSYSGKLEVDDSDNQAGGADHEYEIQLGQGNFYIGAGSDSGNNISLSPTLPNVGYTVGSLALNVGGTAPLNYDGIIGGVTRSVNEANDQEHLSLNYKALGGTFSYIYSPNHNTAGSTNEQSDDADNIDDALGGSAYAVLYTGEPVKNVKVIIGRNEQSGETTTDTTQELTVDKFGVSYNFGQFAAGVEYQTYEDAGTEEANVWNYSVAFKASDALTLGIQYGVAEDEDTASTNPKEKIKAVTAGYNLGPASIALSLVDGESINNVNGTDVKGAVITTKFKF